MANEVFNKLVQVEDSYDQIHQKTWARRTAGMLGGATLGAGYGVVIGTIAAFLPFVLHAIGIATAASLTVPAAAATVFALPTIAAIAASAGLFACIGGGIGTAIGADVGANAGSNAITTSIELENLGTGREEKVAQRTPSKPPSLYVWKAAPVLIGLFAAAGAVMALSPLSATALAMIGFKVGTTAAIAASATVFGTLGALMPLKNSLIHNKISNYYYDLISDKKWAEDETIHPERVIAKVVDVPANEPERPTRSFAANEKPFSLDGILNKTEDRGATLIR